jgi:hypothetical protein
VGAGGVAHLAGAEGEGPQAVLPQFGLHRRDVARQAGVDDPVGEGAVGGVQEAREVGAGEHVVGALHQKQVGGGGVRSQAVPFPLHRRDEPVLVRREMGGVAVGVPQVADQDLGTVGGGPAELHRGVADPAPDDGGLHAEPAQELGQLGDVPEGIGDVADGHFGPPGAGDAVAQEQVAHQRLRAHQKLVRQDKPGANPEPSLLNEPPQAALQVGADIHHVLQDHRLPVQQEETVGRVPLHEVHQFRHQVDQPEAELLVCPVPLPVPVSVRDDVQGVGSVLSHKLLGIPVGEGPRCGA